MKDCKKPIWALPVMRASMNTGCGLCWLISVRRVRSHFSSVRRVASPNPSWSCFGNTVCRRIARQADSAHRDGPACLFCQPSAPFLNKNKNLLESDVTRQTVIILYKRTAKPHRHDRQLADSLCCLIFPRGFDFTKMIPILFLHVSFRRNR